jgi:hypothetical protein
LHSTGAVFEESANLVVCAAEVENECIPLALKDKAQVESTATFHKRRDAAKT